MQKLKRITGTSKKKKKKFLVKHKRFIIEVLISEALIDSYINHDKFFAENNVLRESSKTKKNPKIHKMLFIILYKYGWYNQKKGMEKIV